MSNYLSYLVIRDLSGDESFRKPLMDYILPAYHEGFVMDEVRFVCFQITSCLLFPISTCFYMNLKNQIIVGSTVLCNKSNMNSPYNQIYNSVRTKLATCCRLEAAY